MMAIAKKDKPVLDTRRLNKREFLGLVAARTRLSPVATRKVFDAIVGELIDLTANGTEVTLTGFGKFYPVPHAGHLAQKSIGNNPKPKGVKTVDDYFVLKFSATREVNKKMESNAKFLVSPKELELRRAQRERETKGLQGTKEKTSNSDVEEAAEDE